MNLETIGDEKYNHVGCEGENKLFGDFLVRFVPQVGMRRKVRFTIETIDDAGEHVLDEVRKE